MTLGHHRRLPPNPGCHPNPTIIGRRTTKIPTQIVLTLGQPIAKSVHQFLVPLVLVDYVSQVG